MPMVPFLQGRKLARTHSSQSADLVPGGGASSPADGLAACPFPDEHTVNVCNPVNCGHSEHLQNKSPEPLGGPGLKSIEGDRISTRGAERDLYSRRRGRWWRVRSSCQRRSRIWVSYSQMHHLLPLLRLCGEGCVNSATPKGVTSFSTINGQRESLSG